MRDDVEPAQGPPPHRRPTLPAQPWFGDIDRPAEGGHALRLQRSRRVSVDAGRPGARRPRHAPLPRRKSSAHSRPIPLVPAGDQSLQAPSAPDPEPPPCCSFVDGPAAAREGAGGGRPPEPNTQARGLSRRSTSSRPRRQSCTFGSTMFCRGGPCRTVVSSIVGVELVHPPFARRTSRTSFAIGVCARRPPADGRCRSS